MLIWSLKAEPRTFHLSLSLNSSSIKHLLIKRISSKYIRLDVLMKVEWHVILASWEANYDALYLWIVFINDIYEQCLPWSPWDYFLMFSTKLKFHVYIISYLKWFNDLIWLQIVCQLQPYSWPASAGVSIATLLLTCTSRSIHSNPTPELHQQVYHSNDS